MRHRTTSFRTMLLATAALTPLVVQAQTTAGSSQSGVADAVRVLMDQATYWQGKYQPEKADEALSRVLSLDPRNADALALQAQTAADRGDQQLARSALSKLQAARPDDPRIQTIEQSMRLGPIDPNTLAQARQLAAAGKGEEAVAAYRKVFRGSVPPAGLATEYYQVLSNTDGNFDAGRNGLADLLRANPDDLRAQLAYAELLTYRDGTRDEGLARLERLVTNPTIADQANRDLKQTLLWLPISQASVPAMQAYLARFPNDKDIQQRVELARNDIGGLRVEGFDALEANQTGAAESAFTRALAKAPNDSDSLIGMALVRLKQRRPADARALLQHAIEIDPDKAAQYQPLIDSTDPKAIARASATGGNNGGNTDYGAAAARKIRAQYAEVAALTQHGEFAQAEAHLRALMGRKPNFGNYLQLADIQARAGKLAQSEASYRTALRSQPRNVAALGGLAGVLAREGQTDEANRIFAQLGRSGGGGSVAQTRAASLRQQAQQSSDPAQQDQLYRSAVAADPADPWLRLEFARLLEGQNRDPEAQQVMADVTAAPHPTADQLRAAVYFADGNHNPAQTLALLNRIPEKARTPEMRDVAVRAGVAQDLRSAKDGNSINVARLIALAAQPDPTGLRGASFAQALVKAGNKVGARDVIRAALAARPVQPQQRIAYAGALLGAGFPDDAQHLTQPVQPAALTPLDRSRLAEVRDNAAVFSADNLNGRGETADAYDQLAPRLAREPENPSLNMALARLYEANRQPREALRIAESVLQRNPSNVSAFQSTVGAAIAAGDLRRARSLADQAKSQFPDDPQAWLMSAQVSRADGEDNRALTELRTAKNLRRQQIDASDRQGLFDRSNVVGGTGPRYAQNVPANTMTDVGASGYAPFVHDSGAGAEPVTREYAQYVPPGETAPPKFSNSNPASGTVAGRPAALPPLESSPLQTAQNFQSDTAAYTNPFRPSPVPTIDEPATSTDVLGRRTNANSSSTDALTQDIDQSIAQVQQNVAPRVEASLSLRGRSSELGGGTLLDVEAPVEASFSPAGVGRLKVQVTPVYLNSSGGDSGAIAQYGTNPVLAPLASLVPGGISLPQRTKSVAGSALDVGYAYRYVSADIGSTPLGFPETNVVGGIEFAPRLTNNLTLRVVGERRAVTDSLLSYAGSKDGLTGQTFGGVTRNRGHAQLEGTAGIVNYYVGGGGGVLVGDHVKSNTEVDAGAGFSLPVWTTPTQEVRVGTNFAYFSFDKNLGAFSYGNGGYFSPQQFFSVLFPVSYRQQLTPNLTYLVGGSVGYQEFRAKSELVFPNDPGLQALLNAESAVFGTATRNAGFSGSGIAGGVNGDIDYRVTNNFHIGARAGFDRSGNFSEGTGLIYGRYVFNDPV